MLDMYSITYINKRRDVLLSVCLSVVRCKKIKTSESNTNVLFFFFKILLFSENSTKDFTRFNY